MRKPSLQFLGVFRVTTPTDPFSLPSLNWDFDLSTHALWPNVCARVRTVCLAVYIEILRNGSVSE